MTGALTRATPYNVVLAKSYCHKGRAAEKKTRHEREVKELRVRGIGNRRVRERKQGHTRTKLIEALHDGVE